MLRTSSKILRSEGAHRRELGIYISFRIIKMQRGLGYLRDRLQLLGLRVLSPPKAIFLLFSILFLVSSNRLRLHPSRMSAPAIFLPRRPIMRI
ncbi:hypothetical protein SCHPADRAFT_519477 [Schizopora paradoxa]|uniref:Uncharacterized protein n=1 Tax=Schizopora paradoxa TaxID=27342 RepID=A0A0H2RLY3_9AGAM|nr:hypothetical protein SCHPADRAFT_519477 [Schizopora paradoxa]